MKKRLAMLLSVAMAFSMFANVAFGAAELTTEQKYEALVKDGIFNGIPGSNDPQLNVQTDRGQFAKILALTTNLEIVKDAPPSFKDQNYAKHWAKDYVEAVNKAGYMGGVGNDKFDLKGKVTGEQMAKAFAKALGLEEVKDAPAIDGVSKWAYGWVAAMKAEGYDFSVNGKWNVPVTRAILVDAAYAVRQQTGVVVEKVQVIDEKNIEVTFSDKEVVKVALDKALVEKEKTTVEVTHKGKTYKVDVTLEAVSATTKLTGAKKVEVTFNRAVDTTKATFDIKNSTGGKANVAKVAWNDNKTVATVETVTNFLKGDYTVTVNGVSEKAVDAGKFSVEAEKVTKIEFLSDKAILQKDNHIVTTGYKVYNQYNEDITKAKASGLTVTAGGYTAAADPSGVIKVTGTNPFKKDDKIVINILDVQSQQFATQLLTVSDQAGVAEISISGLHNADKKELTEGESAPQNWGLVLDAKDQYGNVITDPQVIKDNMVSVVTNPTVVDATYADVKTMTIDGVNKLVLPLKLGKDATAVKAGTSQVTLISKTSNARATYDVVVKEAVTVDSITFGNPAVAVVGEKTEIPFTALDQFGNEITNATALNNGFLSIHSTNASNPVFEQDYVTGKAKLYVTPTAEGTVFINAYTKKGKPATASFSAVAKAEGKVVYGTKDFVSNFAENATNTLKSGNIKVQDQYGRDFDFAGKGYKVKVESSNEAAVALSASEIASGKDVTFTAKQPGSSTITLSLYDAAGKLVDGSQFSFTSRVVAKADIKSYEVADLGKLYNNGGSDYAVAVAVNGLLEDGTKVVIPATSYAVNTMDKNLTYDGGKLSAAYDSKAFPSSGEMKKSVVVTVYGASSAVNVPKEIVISDVAPTATKVELKDGSTASKVADKVVSIEAAKFTTAQALAKDVVKVTDQYGVTLSNPNLAVLVTNIKDDNGNALSSLDGVTVKSGFKFQITAIADNALIVDFQVIVK